MIIADEYLCRAANEFAKSAQDFYCTAPPSPDVWSAFGTIIGAIGASIAAFAAIQAWRTARNQLKHQKDESRKNEIRQATAGLITAIHELSEQSEDPTRNGKSDRNKMYQQSVLFELAADKDFDQIRFNYAINWVLKAADLRHRYAVAEKDRKPLNPAHKDFLANLVFHMTQALRNYDRSGGSSDLLQYLSSKFGKSYHSKDRYKDPEIIGLFTEGRNIYRGLTKKYPNSNADTKITLDKPY